MMLAINAPNIITIGLIVAGVCVIFEAIEKKLGIDLDMDGDGRPKTLTQIKQDSGDYTNIDDLRVDSGYVKNKMLRGKKSA
jgi:hypothetical protein